MLVMGILQGRSKFFEILSYPSKGNTTSLGMTGPQRPAGSIVKDQKWCALLNIKIQQTHDMRMHQFFCCFCFFLKLACIDIKQMQDFNGCLFGSQTHMLAEVDLCEASFSQQFHHTIVAELLTEAITHRPLPS